MCCGSVAVLHCRSERCSLLVTFSLHGQAWFWQLLCLCTYMEAAVRAFVALLRIEPNLAL